MISLEKFCATLSTVIFSFVSQLPHVETFSNDYKDF